MCARRYLKLLKEWQHDAILLNTQIPPDSPDVDVIALATKLDAVLLTVDLDFASIVNYPPTDYEGIIVVRYGVTIEASIDATLKAALDDLSRDELRGAPVIISAGRYRIRR